MYETFGVPAHRWDGLTLADLDWMLPELDRQQRSYESAKLNTR